jgi:hypothetical protein
MNIFQAQKVYFRKGVIMSIPLISVILTGCDSPEKSQFITSCKFATRNSSVCACAWDKMSSIYPPKLLKAIGKMEVSPPSGFQSNMTNSIQQCIRED